jgi:SRSO17 transposase
MLHVNLGSIGKVDQGIVAVSSLWADERIYYLLHVTAYTPADKFPLGKQDPNFRTKPEIAMTLIDQALDAGLNFRAIVADCFYGEHRELVKELLASDIAYVLAIKASKAIRAPADKNHTPQEAAQSLEWTDEKSKSAAFSWLPLVYCRARSISITSKFCTSSKKSMPRLR